MSSSLSAVAPLPPVETTTSASPTTSATAITLPPVDLHNIQGDILPGLPKKFEAYWFLQIRDDRVKEFRCNLYKLLPLITSAAQAMRDQDQIDHWKRSSPPEGQLLKLSGVNISFSHKGLVKMGIADPVNDTTTDPFQTGMFNDIANLDDQVEKWLPDFKQEIHCLIFITGESLATVHERYAELKWILDPTINEVKLTVGNARPGKEFGHEHFGYLDGVSQPNIEGIDKSADPNPVQAPIPQGLILTGRPGDESSSGTPTPRPAWALDGSFMAFRYLSQNVPEFQAFVDANNPPNAPKDLLGARLVGRWKSGAPVDITPLHDNPTLGADPAKNNHFLFDPTSQDRCPFAAHIRKTNPRGDFTDPTISQKRRILRRGIPFGPEVSPIEKQNNKTILDRGLLFKCYQSQIAVGFQFLQKTWANNPNFLARKNVTVPGFDAIIGQAANGGPRAMDINGDTNNPNSFKLPVEWVISKGGEYFFLPSISALREEFALKPVLNGYGTYNGNGVHNGNGHEELLI
ncbi:Dyp-type peroxidase [Mollisia scopiformis]|uniref:Dyp-type peroxidase n=1 Tax=Mollisia scopiformis TaxID=149040 RepID=A0A194X7G7_MOLSC|nr:Dyp-type peroxidase [Mollisia scopiformis]KUJ16039.1 Dyp-type peroxidase [Mollisia scopiformis]